MTIKSILAAFAIIVGSVSVASADTPAYTALNKKIEGILKSANAGMDDLIAAMEVDVACKLGEKSGEQCKKSKVTCGKYLATYKTVDEGLAEVRKAIDESTGITKQERQVLELGQMLVKRLHKMMSEYITQRECTST